MVDRVRSGPFQEYTFMTGSFTDSEVTVIAASEQSARRRAMVQIWGSIPDRVTPHAPNYEGQGLSLLRTRPIGDQTNPGIQSGQASGSSPAAAAESA